MFHFPTRSVALFVSAAALAACTAAPAGDSLEFRSDAPAAGKADAVSLSLTELSFVDVGDRDQEGGLAILTSAERWQDYFCVPAPDSIDFDREWAVFFGIGMRNTGGYSAQIPSLEFYAEYDALVVNTLETTPGIDCLVTQAFTSPYLVATFEIPAPTPRFYATSHESKALLCGPSQDERKQQLEDSLATWNDMVDQNGNSYTYTREFLSFTGFSSRTTIVVEDGVVTERLFKSQHMNGGDAFQFHEVGAEVGSNDGGAPPLLVEDLYTICAEEVLTVDPNENFISFSFHDSGLLRVCEAANRFCADDCSRGVDIATFEFN